MTPQVLLRSAGALALAALVGGCDYSGDFLFAGVVPGLPDIYVLTDADGGPITPAVITSFDDVAPNVIYAEVGPPATTDYGGVTFEFVGTGGDVCIWVDPELANWNQSVAAVPSPAGERWNYPDNLYDDGDIDLFAGLSVYYTGSPGETIGDFIVAYEDSLGNEVPISLASCPNAVGLIGEDASAGRGSPEYCTIQATDMDISYTVLLRTWSTPLDDDRLAYGVLFTEGTCEALKQVTQRSEPWTDECLVTGEALQPIDLKENQDPPVYYGFDELDASGRIWPRSLEFEQEYCNAESMQRYCRQELKAMEEAGLQCQREVIDDPDAKCYCGDINDTPSGGAF